MNFFTKVLHTSMIHDNSIVWNSTNSSSPLKYHLLFFTLVLQYIAYISLYNVLEVDFEDHALQKLALTTPIVHKHHAKDVLVSLLHWDGLSKFVPFSHEECLKDKYHIEYVITVYHPNLYV